MNLKNRGRICKYACAVLSATLLFTICTGCDLEEFLNTELEEANDSLSELEESIALALENACRSGEFIDDYGNYAEMSTLEVQNISDIYVADDAESNPYLSDDADYTAKICGVEVQFQTYHRKYLFSGKYVISDEVITQEAVLTLIDLHYDGVKVSEKTAEITPCTSWDSYLLLFDSTFASDHEIATSASEINLDKVNRAIEKDYDAIMDEYETYDAYVQDYDEDIDNLQIETDIVETETETETPTATTKTTTKVTEKVTEETTEKATEAPSVTAYAETYNDYEGSYSYLYIDGNFDYVKIYVYSDDGNIENSNYPSYSQSDSPIDLCINVAAAGTTYVDVTPYYNDGTSGGTYTCTVPATTSGSAAIPVNNLTGQINCHGGTVAGMTTDYVCNGGSYATVRKSLGDTWHVTAKNMYTSYGITWYELWDTDDGDYYGWVDSNYIDFY